MLEVVQIIKYTIPFFGNKRSHPYGKIKVSDGKDTKIVNFENDSFTFKRKRYQLENIGSLYNAILIVKGV